MTDAVVIWTTPPCRRASAARVAARPRDFPASTDPLWSSLIITFDHLLGDSEAPYAAAPDDVKGITKMKPGKPER